MVGNNFLLKRRPPNPRRAGGPEGCYDYFMGSNEQSGSPWRGARSDGKRWRGVSAELRGRAKELRENLTEAESLLWDELRLRRLEGARFRCQHAVETFVFDFYCAEHRLVIEVDGGIHTVPDVAQHDAERQSYLEQQGHQFLRFSNEEVKNHLADVLNQIRSKLRDSPTP